MEAPFIKKEKKKHKRGTPQLYCIVMLKHSDMIGRKVDRVTRRENRKTNRHALTSADLSYLEGGIVCYAMSSIATLQMLISVGTTLKRRNKFHACANPA